MDMYVKDIQAQAAQNLAAASVTVKYVRSAMRIGASNQPRPNLLKASLCAGTLINTGEM